MSVRLFPDIIAAAEVMGSLEDVLVICRNTGRLGSDHFFKEIREIPVSVEMCAKRQHGYRKRGLGNAFLRFGGNDGWTEEEYDDFFSENPSLYRYLSNGRYAAVLNNVFRDPAVSGEEEIRKRMRKFCLSLLAKETYDTEVLKKFGLA